MASNRNHDGAGNTSRQRAPEWADGLKQLYDSVVEEDLPDAFKDLLDQLDGKDAARSSNDNGTAPPNPDDLGAGQ